MAALGLNTGHSDRVQPKGHLPAPSGGFGFWVQLTDRTRNRLVKTSQAL